MGRVFDNNLNNYMKRAAVNYGLNGLTECSHAFWLTVDADTGNTQRLTAKERGTGTTIRANFDPTGLAVGIANAAGAQTPDWLAASPAYTVPTRVLFTWKRNAIDTTDGVIYYNGVSQTITTFAAGGYTGAFTLAEESNNYYFGIRQATLINPVLGKMAWVTIWNRQLTPQEAVLDWQSPTAITSGLLSRVELCPDTDDTFGGTMVVNGALLCFPFNGPVITPITGLGRRMQSVSYSQG